MTLKMTSKAVEANYFEAPEEPHDFDGGTYLYVQIASLLRSIDKK